MKKQTALGGYLSLFTSLGTLLCCALPSLLVLFGLGATVGALLSAAPWLVALSRHKQWVFTISGLLIGGNFLYVYWIAPRMRKRSGACEPGSPQSCDTASKWSRGVLWTSGVIYCAGFFTAYLLGPLLTRFD